jgi:RNA polymerase sigma-70 factor (ECF subfamily)
METEFLQIIEEHQGIIHKVCRMYRSAREDQEDLFQEITLQLWKAFPNFRGASKVSTWMYRIALNTAMASFRKRKVILELRGNELSELPTKTHEESSENQERMFAAIRTLNKAERAIIALYLEDYCYDEIAQLMGISKNYVAVRISRIKTKLRNNII